MSLAGSNATLAQAMKSLEVSWERTGALWTDAKAREFESKYLEPLPAQIKKTLQAFEDIQALLHRVRKDCE